ncbi:hypothetical protein JW868_04330 [Candidatus Woesearchaeota archaeon]|nr:hypothetical protein [Candidatus Woesearchaeota archaeon]
MAEELKIRISDVKAVRSKLKRLGVTPSSVLKVKDTYFNQPKGSIVKITEDSEGDSVIYMRTKAGKFEIIKHDEIENKDEVLTDLKAAYGIRAVLKKKMELFRYKDYTISLNLIEGVGNFLVVEADSLTESFFTETLGIKDPEFITVSFDKLKK